MCAFVVLHLVFPHQAKRLAWGTSPKWPVLCWVGRKTTTQSINLVVVKGEASIGRCSGVIVVSWWRWFEIVWRRRWQLPTRRTRRPAGSRQWPSTQTTRHSAVCSQRSDGQCWPTVLGRWSQRHIDTSYRWVVILYWCRWQVPVWWLQCQYQ